MTLQSDKNPSSTQQIVLDGPSKKKRAEQYNGIRIMNKRQMQQQQQESNERLLDSVIVQRTAVTSIGGSRLGNSKQKLDRKKGSDVTASNHGGIKLAPTANQIFSLSTTENNRRKVYTSNQGKRRHQSSDQNASVTQNTLDPDVPVETRNMSIPPQQRSSKVYQHTDNRR